MTTLRSIRPAKSIRAISAPLVCGEPLLLLPSCQLVRWYDLATIPAVGAAYHHKTITVSSVETIRRVLLAVDALARCDASKAVPLYLLAQLYSYPQAKNMHRVADSLCPEVRRHIRAGTPASLRLLFFVAYGQSPEEQVRRWNETLAGATARQNHAGPVPSSRVRRGRRARILGAGGPASLPSAVLHRSRNRSEETP